MEKIINHREKILEIFRSLGYLYIVLDLGGYRSGSMNRIIQG